MQCLNLSRVDARPSQILHASKGRPFAHFYDVQTQCFAGITEQQPPNRDGEAKCCGDTRAKKWCPTPPKEQPVPKITSLRTRDVSLGMYKPRSSAVSQVACLRHKSAAINDDPCR